MHFYRRITQGYTVRTKLLKSVFFTLLRSVAATLARSVSFHFSVVSVV